MFCSKATLAAYLIVLSLTLSVRGEGRNASILVFGRFGSGVSSTVRMLLGSFTPPKPTETDSSNSSAVNSVITEYVVPIPGDSDSFLKIVDIDGVTDDRHPEDDAYVQASLRTYLAHPEGLDSQRPTAVLIVSQFDDAPSQFKGNESRYVAMLSRIADVEKSVYGDEIPDMNILLFTRLMAETKSAQRSPRRKLESFRSTAIEHVDGISPNIVTLVGENKGEDYGLTLNADGTYRLPNRQFYPTNVFAAVANLADSNGVSNEKSVVETFAALRLNSNGDDNIEALRVPFTVAPDSKDVDNFTRSIVRSGLGEIDENEVNAALQATYESLKDVNLKRRITTSVPTLQAFLQSSNITQLNDLPSTRQNKAKLFISLPVLINKDVVGFLREALNLTMPPFNQSLTVGHGYNLLTDEVLPSTSIPFAPTEINTWTFSSLGYLLPNFLSCHQLPHTQKQEHVHSAETVDQSVVQRQTFLDYPNKDALNISTFDGHLRLGFNVKPSADDVPAFSFVREFRTHKMQLNERTELSEEFKDSVRPLTPLNSTNRSSEKEWRSFFERWGTHVVSSGFLGGILQGTLISDDIRAAYANANETSSVVEQVSDIPKFMEKMIYSAVGGHKDPKLTTFPQLQAKERMEVLEPWISSLFYGPVGLAYQMELIPISSLIGRVNETMAQPAAKALDLFLRGNFTYGRRFRLSRGSYSSQTTVRPSTTSTMAAATTISSESVVSEQETESQGFSEAQTHNATVEDSAVKMAAEFAEVVKKASRWAAHNPNRLDFLDSYLEGAAALRREAELKAYAESARKHKERLEAARQRTRAEKVQLDEEHLGLLEEQRTGRLMESQKRLGELQETVRQREQQTAKPVERESSWIGWATKMRNAFGVSDR